VSKVTGTWDTFEEVGKKTDQKTNMGFQGVVPPGPGHAGMSES
jgi:hypothetical protein